MDEKSQQIDDLVTGSVNASASVAASADEIAAWIQDANTDGPRSGGALTSFFFEVPLETQVAFLASHAISEDHALHVASQLAGNERTIPLQRRTRW